MGADAELHKLRSEKVHYFFLWVVLYENENLFLSLHYEKELLNPVNFLHFKSSLSVLRLLLIELLSKPQTVDFSSITGLCVYLQTALIAHTEHEGFVKDQMGPLVLRQSF